MTPRYTGHPIVDVGVATICAFCEKPDPAGLTREALVRVAEFLEREYFSGKLKAFLSVVFPNSLPFQAEITPRHREDFVKRFRAEVLRAFEGAADQNAAGLRCSFCGDPAARIVYRQHVPMITGEGVLNFFPAGLGGMPICGGCLLAVQTFPLGARRCHGRALAVHCPDDHSFTYAFAQRFLSDNRSLLVLAQKTGEKYEDAKAPRTLVVDALLEIARRRGAFASTAPTLPSVTVYHLTNSGQGPDIDIFELPSEVVSFVAAACRAGTADTWNSMVARAWENPAAPRRAGAKRDSRNQQETQEPPPAPRAGKNRNFLYEALFALRDKPADFIRTYFLRRAWRSARQSKNDPRAQYSAARELELVSWPLTHLFLKEVLGMDRARIEAIRTLADRVAEHIQSRSDGRLFQRLYMARRYDGLRALLLRASRERVASGEPPLIGFDEFVLIFEQGEEVPFIDWRLARDLVLIRLIEQLRDFFRKEPAPLEAVIEPEDTEESGDQPATASSQSLETGALRGA
jgi:CRISPR-associated protein Cst1